MQNDTHHPVLRSRAGRKRSSPITLPTPFTLKRFEEMELVIAPLEEVDIYKRPTGMIYNRITPQIDIFLRQGKLSQLAHEALTRYVTHVDKVHLAASCGGASYEPREYESGTPDPGARIERATDVIQLLTKVKSGLSAHWTPYLEWVAPDGRALPWRKQVKIWWPWLARRASEDKFFLNLQELGDTLALRFNLVSSGGRTNAR